MQDNYFNKLQGASSLFMKSDHDGEKDSQNRKMPLGIKSVAQGIEHFTDWKNLSNTLEQNNLSNFEDEQPNGVKFSQSYMPVEEGGYGDFRFPKPAEEGLEWRSFSDTWSANKVKVLDDMAFVAYDEYTDLHRCDIDLAGIQFKQYAVAYNQNVSSNTIDTDFNYVGSLVSSVGEFNRTQRSSYQDRTGGFFNFVRFSPSLTLADYHNSILKIEFDSGDIGYFLYGGAQRNDFEELSIPLNSTSLKYKTSTPYTVKTVNNNIDISTCDYVAQSNYTKEFSKSSIFKHEAIWGSFYLVNYEADTSGVWGENDFGEKYLIPKTGHVAIQLSIQAAVPSLALQKSSFTTDANGNILKTDLYSANINVRSAKFIKIQPVRKCGKIDIYTKKRSIVGAILGNKITSNNHNLKNNDIIEMSNVLFDGAQNGVADTHPLNGIKYVRVVDDDTFEVFDDKFFNNPSSTNNIRTTDGITWKCISNNFGSAGQSWDYHATMFSPTGRNGYKHFNKSSINSDKTSHDYYRDELCTPEQFITSKRPAKLKEKFNTKGPSTGENKSIYLNFADDYEELINSSFGKDIDVSIPRSLNTPHRNPLDDLPRAYWDFYPYDSYWGMRFGCDFDIKFSHMSGDSRVYVLAVGERGSDLAVDLIGLEDDSSRIYRASEGANDQHYIWGREKVFPWSLPHGKTHIISITVDRYNRISDISHSNTLFGGGVSIVDDNQAYGSKLLREYNPWDKFYRERIRPNYSTGAIGFGTIASIVAMSYLRSYENEGYHYNNIKYYDDFSGRRIYNSSYWFRSAVLHWYPQSIHDYKVKFDNERSSKYIRRLSSNPPPRYPGLTNGARRTIPVYGDNLNNYSRFGSVGFGGEVYPYQRIDRYGTYVENASTSAVPFFLFPWVDSFGKSVAINVKPDLRSVSGYSDSDTKLVVVSSSTSRSNIEYNESDYSIPLATNKILKEEDTRSKIGQLQANFVYSDGSNLNNLDFVYINSDGSDCGRFMENLTLRADPNSGGFNNNHQRVLKTGTLAGYGIPEVVSSCYLSALHIEFDGDKLIWVDQHLYGNQSVVNVLSFDDSADFVFSKSDQFTRPFLFPRDLDAVNVGDGFGVDFRYENNVFLTNSRDKTTELGVNISDHLTDRDRIDYLLLYEKDRYGKFEEVQKISPTINRLDEEKYSLGLLSYWNIATNIFQFNRRLLDLPGAVTYDNNAINSLTWDVDLGGRYDLVNGKILLKDPLEYSLFSRNYSVKEKDYSTSITEEYADMYMAISEDVKLSSSKSASSLNYNYIPPESTEYTCRQIVGQKSSTVGSATPFFFFKLPINDLDTIENLEINFDIIGEDVYSSFSVHGDLDLVDNPDNIVPRVILYSRDPRTTIIENGPADRGSSNSFPKYQNGIWTQLRDIVDGGEYYSHQFPGWYRGGAQDMFFYGRHPSNYVRRGSVSLPSNPAPYLYGGETNLGDYYDATAGSRLSGLAGDPAWLAPDVFRHINSVARTFIVPYAKLFLPQATADGYSVVIPREELKDYIINKNLIKDTERPTSVVSGFSDSENSYGIENIDYSIIIGLFLTNIESFDLRSSTITHEEPADGFTVGPLHYILEDETHNYANARYPYSNVCNFYSSSFNGNQYSGRRVEYDLRTTVKSLSVSLSKKQNTQNKYSNKFHKIAVFAYDQEPRLDLVGRYNIEGVNVFKTFGSNNFIPVPNTSNENPIISIGRKSPAFNFTGSDDILTTENITSIDTTYHIDIDTGNIEYNITPSSVVFGKSGFDQAGLLGSFDVNDNKFLSLNIHSNPTDKEGIDLYHEGVAPISGSISLKAAGLNSYVGDASLWTGIFNKQEDISLFVHPPYARPMSLFTYEVKPSGRINLFTRSIDSFNSVPLIFSPPSTGVTPLNIRGPSPINNSMNLAWVPSFSGDISAYIKAKGIETKDANLNMNAVQPVNFGTTLTFSPGFSGVTPLFLARNLESSGNMSLTMTNPFDIQNTSMPLKISKNTNKGAINTFIKSQRYNNKNIDTFINSQEPFNNNARLFVNSQIENNSHLNTYIRSVFPSGEMDLYLSPIDYSPTGIMTLHMENTQATMPLHLEYGLPGDAPLLIGGFAPSHNQKMSMLLMNKEYRDGINMFVDPIGRINTHQSLNTIGSLASGATGFASLFVGKEVHSNNSASLYALNDIFAPSAGSDVFSSGITASVSGGLNYNNYSNSTLSISGPSFLPISTQSEMFLKTDEPVLSEYGNILSSGSFGFVTAGNNDAGVYYKNNNSVGLFTVNADTLTSNATLYLNRPKEAGIPMFVQSLTDSQDINVYISGANSAYGVSSLYIYTPFNTGVQIFTRGYLE